MGSGGSKSRDKRGKAAPAEGARHQQQPLEEQQEQKAAEKIVGEPQRLQPQVEKPTTVEGEKMSEEYVEAVVAKASEFGDNE